MVADIYRDSLSAWRGLREIGGIEINDRDEDLVIQLRNELDPDAPDLEAALLRSTTNQFLQALFQTVQPFVEMFRNILSFFEQAGTIDGQSQWRIRIDEELIEFSHFREVIEYWTSIECRFNLPALDRDNAFIFNHVRIENDNYGYLREGEKHAGVIVTGIHDADAWLANYSSGFYTPFPQSLHPDRFPPGLDDAAYVVMAALSVIRNLGLTRDQMLSEHRARSYRSVAGDAFHPWTIAQNETDLWLGSHIQYLANILQKPQEEQKAFGERLAVAYSKFSRKRFDANVDIRDFEQLLSLPVWKKRYELYGVWVATRVIASLSDHSVIIHHEEGELKFVFSETKIADIESSWPKLSFISERRSPLSNPLGKGRVEAVQPDFGIWTRDVGLKECKLIIEVKHYKKRSRRNFRAALIDYATAHERAKVVLVNYGPVGQSFSDLAQSIADRCTMIGDFKPGNEASQSKFRTLVQSCVGAPVEEASRTSETAHFQVIAIDISSSMFEALQSTWFLTFVESLPDDGKLALVDQELRGFVGRDFLREWLHRNELGPATSLAGPVSELLVKYDQVLILTDQDGLDSLQPSQVAEVNAIDNHPDIKLVRVRRFGSA